MLAELQAVVHPKGVKAKPSNNSRPQKRASSSRVKEAAAVYHPGLKAPAAPALKDMSEKFGLRQETLSRMTGFSLRAVAGWASGEAPSAPVRRALTEMDRLLDGLSHLMKAKEVGHWLKAPNQAFDGSTPVQVIECGQVDRIWRMLYHVESGEPG